MRFNQADGIRRCSAMRGLLLAAVAVIACTSNSRLKTGAPDASSAAGGMGGTATSESAGAGVPATNSAQAGATGTDPTQAGNTGPGFGAAGTDGLGGNPDSGTTTDRAGSPGSPATSVDAASADSGAGLIDSGSVPRADAGLDAGTTARDSKSDSAGPSAPDAGSSCPVLKAGPFGPGSARSAGYTGTLTAFSALYDLVCTSVSDCEKACVAAGGTGESCRGGSECYESLGSKSCLPPEYWLFADQALSADSTNAELTLVSIPYQDPLVLSNFGIQIPADATIRGIQFDVRRATDVPDMAADYSVRIMRGGQAVGSDRKQTGNWPSSLTYGSYGGPADTWDTSWTPADLMNSQFGLSITAQYTETTGNARAYVDYVRVSITYTKGNCQ